MVGPATVAEDGESAVFDLGVPTEGAPGDFYTLCWGPGGDLADLLVKLDGVGELTGPELNEFVCTLGLHCSLDLHGYQLADHSSILVISEGNCGDADAVPAVWTGPVLTEVELVPAPVP